MRLIDGDELLEILRIMQEVYFDRKIILGKVVEEVKRMPTIEPEPKWIPVSKKAHPPKEGKYLVTDDAGGMATVDVDDFIYCDDGSGMWLCSQNVTAWMPYKLPEPYKENK